ncbi:MAG: hypothetical protein HQL72_07605 [Magnetococcales bacterium]|nr:hypothetical protein [Magnetococcales bacterium]
MTIVVNLSVLSLLSFMLFQIARQGLIDLEQGISGTIIFTSIIVIYLVVIFRMIFHNLAEKKDHQSIHFFFTEEAQKQFRGRPDHVVKTVSWIVALCWAVVVTLLASLHEASPPIQEVASLGIETAVPLFSAGWNPTWAHFAYLLTLLVSLLSAVGLFLQSRRNRRLTDRYPPSLVTIFLISLIASIYFY